MSANKDDETVAANADLQALGDILFPESIDDFNKPGNVASLPHNMLPGRDNLQYRPDCSDSEDSGLEESVRASRSDTPPPPSSPQVNRLPGPPGTPIFNWQASKSSLKDRFSYLFNNEILSDVHFLVGREPGRQRIPAHKLILTAGSAVFDAMFNGTLATSAPEVEVPDVEPSAFLALLRFLYSDEVQIGPETVMTTLYTAKKYAVPALERHCVDFLKSNLRADNAFMLLTQARLFDEPQLASLCLDKIDKDTSEAISADGFTDVDLETLSVVMSRDTLHIRESKLYNAIMRWCEARCQRKQLAPTPENMRVVLDQALYLVRFPLMGLEEFAQGPAQSGILTDREVVSLFLYFTVNPKPSLRFKHNRVKVFTLPNVTSEIFRESSAGHNDGLKLKSSNHTYERLTHCEGLVGLLYGLDDFSFRPPLCPSLLSLKMALVTMPERWVMDTPRCSLTGKEQSVNRFQQVDSRWGYSGTSDRIRFMVDRRVYVVGFGLYGSIHGACEYDVTIEIVIPVSGKVCGSNSTRVTYDGSASTYKVMFKEPIEIRPHTHYMASALIKGPDSHYGTRGQRKVSVDSTNGKIAFHFTYAAGNNNGTSVEDGQIPEILFYT